MTPEKIDWSQQHCGVRQAPASVVRELMPDLACVLDTFPGTEDAFTWDVKVHMLMPRQYPCIPDWHTDSVPRVAGIQQFDACKTHLSMYAWISGAPLTEFAGGYLAPRTWHRFNQLTQHRGTAAADHGWRGFIRATDREIRDHRPDRQYLRRHCQVYLDANNYQW